MLGVVAFGFVGFGLLGLYIGTAGALDTWQVVGLTLALGLIGGLGGLIGVVL